MDTEQILRHVSLVGTGYRLLTWDANRQMGTGQHVVGYRFTAPDGTVLFEAEDYGCAPSDPIDSNEALRGLLVFLTLKPGDTDSEYFEKYTETQREFAEGDAEELQVWGMSAEDFEGEPPGFEEIQE